MVLENYIDPELWSIVFESLSEIKWLHIAY